LYPFAFGFAARGGTRDEHGTTARVIRELPPPVLAPPLTLGRTPRTPDGILNFQLDAHQGSMHVIVRAAGRTRERDTHSAVHVIF